jgi:ankyrin repeat protein
VKPVDNQGKQPMHWAAEYGDLKVLKVHLADPRIEPWAKTLENDPSRTGVNVMDLAISSGHKHVIEYLETFWVHYED